MTTFKRVYGHGNVLISGLCFSLNNIETPKSYWWYWRLIMLLKQLTAWQEVYCAQCWGWMQVSRLQSRETVTITQSLSQSEAFIALALTNQRPENQSSGCRWSPLLTQRWRPADNAAWNAGSGGAGQSGQMQQAQCREGGFLTNTISHSVRMKYGVHLV